jgi:aryl-alcohol dehydrogenase-like predicted oxidoreductase
VGSNPADAALAWVLHNPVVTALIIGPPIIEQLNGSLRVFEILLSEDTLQRFDEIWPDPSGEAPEAYAW